MGRPKKLSMGAVLAIIALLVPGLLAAEDREQVSLPRISGAPTLEDFLTMEPGSDVAEEMVRVSGYIQQEPSDGQPATERTDTYLGYDDKNLYVVFVAFDSEPEKIRARMVPRENIFSDDQVEIMLDTFHDERRAYVFLVNPLGIQMDGLFAEGSGRGGFDFSFDTLWYSRGQVTDRGYVVWMSIPFKSLRFPAGEDQRWGFLLHRAIPRKDERIFWPHISSRIQGRMNQAADLVGLNNISPGRNIQLIPYGVFNSFRALDTRDENFPRFVKEKGDADVGLDAKFVIKDSLVLDVAINPDFSQVESDQPQVTTNQRFEVFFPERRPFFLENASFFQTPINLVFTRRIADPSMGIRLTGKAGPYAIGAMVMDDEAPGKVVLPGDPDEGKRALFSIFRVNRDVFGQSTIGAIYAGREFGDQYNRVGGVDGRFRFNNNWVANLQAITSATNDEDGIRSAGPAYNAEIRHSGRKLNYGMEYNDFGRGFVTVPGFVRRTGIRRVEQSVRYRWRPEGKRLISWGPRVSTEAVYDHTGLRLDFTQDTNLSWEFTGQTRLTVFYNYDRERLRPEDFEELLANKDFSRARKGFFFNSSYFSNYTFRMSFSEGTRINFVPPAGEAPVLANLTSGDLSVTVRPIAPLRIDNSYILERLTSREVDAGIFTNHITRSRWNWQFSREFSLRVILQYDSVLPNPLTSDLDRRKNVNADVLLTYLLHPGTVLFLGYNSNLQNIHLAPGIDPDTGADIIEIKRRRNQYINDGRGFFAKFSYLFRF